MKSNVFSNLKFVIIFFLATSPLIINAQLTFELKGLVNDKISSKIKKGDKVELHEINNYKGEQVVVSINGNKEEISFNQLDKIIFNPSTSKQFWQNQMLKNSVFENILKNGLQYDLRKGLEEDAIEYIEYMEENNLTFVDSYLESYIYSLVYKIYPNKLDDGRPGILNVKIIKDLNPNAGIYSNGTMIITTGLLSTINSEEELIGVLAHEVAHFVLDHSIININKVEKRKKRAEFWAAFATGIAIAADTYVSVNNRNNSSYIPGTISVSGAVLSYSIAALVNERMGLKFSREQEMEADKCAVELMQFLEVDQGALSSALNKIKEYCIVTGNYLALTGKGTHPAIDDRIQEIGEPKEFMDANYDKTISFVNSINSLYELRNQHFSTTAELVERNIDAKVATEEDYLLKALTNLYMFDTDVKNKESLAYLETAKNLNVYPIAAIYKFEAILLIRLKRLKEAKISLTTYLEKLEKSDSKGKEYEWTKKMINKVEKL